MTSVRRLPLPSASFLSLGRQQAGVIHRSSAVPRAVIFSGSGGGSFYMETFASRLARNNALLDRIVKQRIDLKLSMHKPTDFQRLEIHLHCHFSALRAPCS